MQRELVRRGDSSSAVPCHLVAGDGHLRERQCQKVLRNTPGFAATQNRILDVLTARTGKHQLGTALVHSLGKVEILHGYFTHFSSTGTGRRRLGLAPGPAENADLATVLRVGA